MTKNHYNNVIAWTLKNDPAAKTEDTLVGARAIFKNMGVALPNGNMETVASILATNDYMGWRACSAEEAQAAADRGTAAIAVTEDAIHILPAADDTLNSDAAVVRAVDEAAVYYTYSCGTTTEEPPMPIEPPFVDPNPEPDPPPEQSNNRDYRGNIILSDSLLALLEENRPFYEASASLYKIPWKMLAGIHYREYKLKRQGPTNGNGPYQIWGSQYPVGTLTDAQFSSATNAAAEFIAQKAAGRDLSVSDNVKYTFFAYNGIASAYKTQALELGFSQSQANIGEGSPYVMNRADARRDPTVSPTSSNQTWGQIKQDGGNLVYPANSDYGAFVVYNAI